MKAVARVSLAIAMMMCGSAAQADVFTLEDALSMAYETNLRLAAERANLRATDEDVARARAGLKPRLSGNAYYGLSDTHKQTSTTSTHPLNAEVTLTEDLFRGGRTFAEIERAKALDLAERGRLTATEQSVLLDAVTAYMDVVRDRARVVISQKNVEVLRQTHESVQKMFAAGAVTKTDVQQSEARLAQARMSLFSARASLDASQANFEHVIGRPAETLESSPALPVLPMSLDAAIEEARLQNPEVLVAKNEEKAASQAVNDAVGALLPQVSVVGQYQYTHDYQTLGNYQIQNPQNQLSILGEVTVPIYQGGEEEAAVRQAKQLHTKAKLATADADKHAEEGVKAAWSAYQAANDSIAASEAQMRADELAVAGVTLEQQSGERSVLDILNAQQEYLTAQIAAVNAVHDRLVAAYRLLSSTGGLTAAALQLKINPYDPRQYYDDNAGKWFGLGE